MIMKVYQFVSVLGVAITSTLGFLFWDHTPKSELKEINVTEKSITFILGEDGKSSEYYDRAVEYFTLNPAGQTDYIIRSVRSLGGVINYLNHVSSKKSILWSDVNIVVHGNPNTGLRTSLYDSGPRATPKRLVQALILDTMPSLNGGVVNDGTDINIYSCGVGTSSILSWTLKQVFKPEHGLSPQVNCSEHFIVFHPSMDGTVMNMVKARYYPYYYKRGYRPSRSEITAEMKKQYPGQNISWEQALLREQNMDATFNNEYHIPVKYTRTYRTKSERPALSTQAQKISWVMRQPELMAAVEDSGIPLDKFTWHVDRVLISGDGGNTTPAVRAIGMSTVLCVLDPIG